MVIEAKQTCSTARRSGSSLRRCSGRIGRTWPIAQVSGRLWKTEKLQMYLSGQAILSISEQADPCSVGSLFCLRVGEEHVSFEVNLDSVARSGVQIRNTLIVPDTLTLSEALESFKAAGEDFAVIMNEYALVVGIITLNDVMTTLMGDLVGQGLEEQIVARDEQEHYLKNDLLALAGTHANIELELLERSQLPDFLVRMRLVSRQTRALVCGHPDSVEAFAKRLFLAGLGRNQLLADAFLTRS